MSTATLPCHTPPTAGDNAGVIAPPPLIFGVGIGTGLLLKPVAALTADTRHRRHVGRDRTGHRGCRVSG
jgi:hypothetical protein